jgi:hypothetical protein
VHLWEPYRLIFEPTDSSEAMSPDGDIDIRLVKKIRILEIVDYHGN